MNRQNYIQIISTRIIQFNVDVGRITEVDFDLNNIFGFGMTREEVIQKQIEETKTINRKKEMRREND